VKGYLKQWYVDFGESVKAGQLLAEIDTPDLDANLEVAETKLIAARAMVETRQAEWAFAKSTYERWHNAPVGVVSVQGTLAKQDDFEIAETRLHTAMAK
jgi:multidrug resistance efflux pump